MKAPPSLPALPQAQRLGGRPGWPLAGLAWRLPWPLPAVLAWAAGFLVWRLGAAWGATPALAWAAGLLAAAGLALACQGRWRRVLAGAGFPLASLVLALGGTGPSLPPWAWGAAAAVLLLLYPLGAWRDAPWFPTPAGALDGLGAACAAQPPAAVLDAGCGLGHGLLELRRQFPAAQVQGIERSRPLRWAAAWRCPWARVRGGDIWAADWSAYGLVYVFQRPESMARAHAKAMAELPPGGWLASLEFEVPGVPPVLCLPGAQGRPVWLYRRGSTASAGCR